MEGEGGEQGSVMELTFSPDFSGNNGKFKVVEVTPEILDEIRKGDGSVCIKGLPSEEAVLCTKTKTYSIRHLDSTNTMLLLPAESPVVSGSFNGHFELSPILPKLHALSQLLMQEASITQEEVEETEEEEDADGMELVVEAKGKKGYTWEQLQDRVQASDAELEEALYNMGAIQWRGRRGEGEGRWRVLAQDYDDAITELLLTTIRSHDWPLSHVPLEECVAEGESIYPAIFVEHCLKCLTLGGLKAAEKEKEKERTTMLSLDPERICQFRARQILSSTPNKPSWLYEEFLAKWTDTVRDDGVPLEAINVDSLKGLVLVTEIGAEKHASLFPVSSLPPHPKERFAILFKKRPKWTVEDIAPYVSDLVSGDITTEAFLSQYARMSTQAGVVFYSQR
ncbi:Sister chromatid cohesion protein DCC1 [Balamuthia mandrillaris]